MRPLPSGELPQSERSAERPRTDAEPKGGPRRLAEPKIETAGEAPYREKSVPQSFYP